MDIESQLRAALAAFDADAFVRRHGGYKESMSQMSREWLLPCPSCGSERLRWRHEPGHKQAWICWGCKMTGSSFDLIKRLEKLTYIEAVNFVLSDYMGGDCPTELKAAIRPRRNQVSRAELLPVMKYPRGFERIDFNNPLHTRACQYAAYRGLSKKDIHDYNLGFCRSGRLTNYIVFPCLMDGGLVYWQARATWDPPQFAQKDQLKQWVKSTNYRKTLNPMNSEGGASARQVLFNFDKARTSTHVVITEGPVDAIKVGLHAVALLGKAITPEKVAKLRQMNTERYTIYLDRGPEELRNAYELAKQLVDFARVYVAQPPEGFDPGKLTKAQNAHVIQQAQLFKGGLVSSLNP